MELFDYIEVFYNQRRRHSSLGLSTVKGLVHLQAAGLVLVYGLTESPHTLVAAKYETGEVIWKQTGLYTTPALAPKARKLQYAAHLPTAGSS